MCITSTSNSLNLFTPNKQRVTEKVEVDINSNNLDEQVGAEFAEQLRNDLELVNGVYPDFDVEAYRRAEVAPVFFGSALNNFGVQELLDCFVEIAPSPRPTKAEERVVEPTEPKFTGSSLRLQPISTLIIAVVLPSVRCVRVSSNATNLTSMCVMGRRCASPPLLSLWHNVRVL